MSTSTIARRRWMIAGTSAAMLGSVLISTPSSAGAPPPRRWVQADDFRFCAGGASTCVASNTGFTIHVRTGTQVVWYYNDDKCNAGCPGHNVAFPANSGPIRKADKALLYARTFNTPGTFTYHCDVHQGIGMTGKIIVHPQPT